MTKREAYLAALRREPVDELVWAPNSDYWLAVNHAEGTVPAQYAGMSRNEIVRAIGGTIWNRATGFRTVLDPTVEKVWLEEGDAAVHELRTPVGCVREVSLPTEGAHRSRFISERFLKSVDDIRTMCYVVEATHYEPDYAPAEQALAETGDDGIVLHQVLCVPYIQVVKNDAGYVNGAYLWADHRAEMQGLVDLYFESFLDAYRVLAAGPADAIQTGDNMDGATISPAVFRDQCIPFYREAARVAHEGGKLLKGHWCGRTQNLLPLVPSCGLDVVEAIVTRPMAPVTLADALDMLRGEVAFQGGIPSVVVCEEGGTYDDFVRYIEETILPLRGRPGFVLGMSDNVPPNADFRRVEAVAGLISA